MESQAALYQLFQAFVQFLYTIEQIYFKPQEQVNLINLEVGDESEDERWTNDSLFNPLYHISNDWDDVDSGYFSDEEEIPIVQQRIQGYRFINDYIRENDNIDKQQYFLMSNDIDDVDMRHYYEQGMNKGSCWNCSNEYSHMCCAACKRFISSCDCRYICGYTCPSGQRNKRGEYTQVTKCKYYTNNIDDVIHDCQGMFKEEHVILFIDETETKRFNQNNISRVKHCHRCKKDGHFSYQCTDFICYSCGGKGHLAKNCSLLYFDNV